MDKPAGQWIHYSELMPFATRGPLDEEWDAYRREAGRLISEGHEGQFVLIHGNDILGFFENENEAFAEGYRRFLFAKEPFLVHQVQTYERLLRIRVA